MTSRTIHDLSETPITESMVNSSPEVNNPASPLDGPGFVAPIEVGGYFPANIPYTPQVDLFGIEFTNRDGSTNPGPDGIYGTADDIQLAERFNVNPDYIPATIPLDEQLQPQNSYGVISGIDPNSQSRGIATLPGGMPIYKTAGGTTQLVGGIGVFYPGTTGYASEENSSLGAGYNPNLPDLSVEAEYVAFAALGGAPLIGLPVGTLGGVAPVANIIFPITPDNQAITLNGVNLDIVGPGGVAGPTNLLQFGQVLGAGVVNGHDLPITAGPSPLFLQNGVPVPDGWLVLPHAGGDLSAQDVVNMIQQGVAQADLTRAQIRLPAGVNAEQTFAVTDPQGDVLGLYRMPDSTVFSIGVAVAKARNVAYYADPTQLQPQDQLAGIPDGTALTSRTFRYLSLTHFPEGIAGEPPAPWSSLNSARSSRCPTRPTSARSSRGRCTPRRASTRSWPTTPMPISTIPTTLPTRMAWCSSRDPCRSM